MIIEDMAAFAQDAGLKKKIIIAICNPNFHSVCLFRLSSFFYRLHLAPFAKLIWYINRLLFHVDIDYRAKLAGGFRLVHGLGTVIGHEVVSEGSLTVYQGVTIGGSQKHSRMLKDGTVIRQPIIGHNVVVYTGAGIYGPVIIEDNCIIKAGSIISRDFGNNSSSNKNIAIGSPES